MTITTLHKRILYKLVKPKKNIKNSSRNCRELIMIDKQIACQFKICKVNKI